MKGYISPLPHPGEGGGGEGGDDGKIRYFYKLLECIMVYKRWECLQFQMFASMEE